MRKIKINAVSLRTCLLISLFALSNAVGQATMPISEGNSDITRDGEIIWVDYVTSDAKAGKKFFSALLGWKFKKHGAYSLALSNNKPVAGILDDSELVDGEYNGYWVVSASVNDVNSTSTAI